MSERRVYAKTIQMPQNRASPALSQLFAVGALVRNISESAIIPIAGMFLTFIACYDLIQLIIEHNMNNLLIDQEASQ